MADIYDEINDLEFEVVTMTDENGDAVEFSIIDNVACGGERYLLVVETELMDDDETDAIAAAVLGGTSFFGGTGSVGGLLIGVLIIGLISNGLNLMHVNSYWQYVLKGIIIIAAVYVDMVKQKKQNAAK